MQVLLIRAFNSVAPRWILPAGGIDPGEDIERAAARETMEEVRIVLGMWRSKTARHSTCGRTQFLKPCCVVSAYRLGVLERLLHILGVLRYVPCVAAVVREEADLVSLLQAPHTFLALVCDRRTRISAHGPSFT